jgi:hypothetical protein
LTRTITVCPRPPLRAGFIFKELDMADDMTVIPLDALDEIMTRIAIRDGKASLDALVEEARPKDSPIHDCFEWDDKRRADQFREEVARQMVCTVLGTAEEGWKVPPFDRTALMNIMKRLEARDGHVAPSAVVEEARSEGCPLHDSFVWDDETIGECAREVTAYRLVDTHLEIFDDGVIPDH